MSNGQLNNVSMSNAMQLVSQEPALKTAVTADGQQQDGGNFAGLLSGIQSTAKMQASSDSGQAGQPAKRVGEEQLTRDAGSENPVVDLLAQISIPPRSITAAELAAAMPEKPEEGEVNQLQGSDPSDVASRLVMAAYSQPGRMPEVNIPTEPDADVLQNAATAVTEMPTEKQAVKTSAQLSEERVQRQQSGLGQFPITDGQPVKGVLAEQLPASSFQPAEYDRKSSGELPAQQLVDRSQNVASSTAQPGFFTASNDKIRVERVGTLSSLTAPVPALGEPIVQAGAMHAAPAEKMAGAQTGPPADQLTAAVAASSPESEIEMQISQPRPISAQVTAGVRQQLNGEPQVEKVLTGSEKDNAKEMSSSRQLPVSDIESMPGSDHSGAGGSSQGQSDVASENGMLPHDMRGQLRTEQQSATVPSAKAVPAEPLRQDIPEQVAQQVKERLVQHEVKPGNQQITLTLSPDSLGEIKMNLNLQGQKLSVEILTENRAVRDAIIQHTDSLKESLARQNITMESFDVTTGGKGSANQGQNQNAWRELARQQQQFWPSPRGYQTAQAAPSSDHAAYQRGQGQTMLDIHY